MARPPRTPLALASPGPDGGRRPPARRPRAALAALALAPVGLAAPARAAGPLGPPGAPVTTSGYAIDFFQGPVLASTRVTGLAGASAAIAEGVDGLYVNPAAPAVRVPWSHAHVDYDLSAGVTLPSTLAETDFDNNGTRGFTYRDFVFFNAGATLQAGPFGFGLTFDATTYRLDDERAAAPRAVRVDLGRVRVAAAYAFGRGELVVGAGLRTGFLRLGSPGRSQDLASLGAGAGLEAGAVYGPFGLPVRAALAVRSAVPTGLDPATGGPGPDARGDLVVAGLYLPRRVLQPWEVEAGVAWQFGPRPLNLPWDDPREQARALVEAVRRGQAERRARGEPDDPGRRAAEELLARRAAEVVGAARRGAYARLPRRRLLALASLLASGPARRAVGVESFLAQTVERSGERVSLTPRAALEAELVPNVAQARAGTYLEPSRFRGGSARAHGTAGLDLRLFPWTVFGLWDEGTYWRASGFLDAAREYVSFGGSVGVWH
jgi:hypothetical protein